MSERLPVVAAIPNYNMAQQLTELLPQLFEQEYDDIFVLDDASTDASRDLVGSLSDKVHFISNRVNSGAGATRNLITDALGYKAIIHFMDADVELETERVPELANDLMSNEPVGFVGGLVNTARGNQSVWNYGPRHSLRGDIGAVVQSVVEPLVTEHPKMAKLVMTSFRPLLSDHPDPFSSPVRRPIFWNSEANLLIKSDVFADIGGFDETLRESEILDLSIRMYNWGLRRYFDPSISVRHKEIEVRNYNRQLAMRREELAIARKHGIRNWILPDGKFKAEL